MPWRGTACSHTGGGGGGFHGWTCERSVLVIGEEWGTTYDIYNISCGTACLYQEQSRIYDAYKYRQGKRRLGF